jgi:hypothetical protein
MMVAPAPAPANVVSDVSRRSSSNVIEPRTRTVLGPDRFMAAINSLALATA